MSLSEPDRRILQDIHDHGGYFDDQVNGDEWGVFDRYIRAGLLQHNNDLFSVTDAGVQAIREATDKLRRRTRRGLGIVVLFACATTGAVMMDATTVALALGAVTLIAFCIVWRTRR